MSTQPAARPWTYEEFARLPDDGQRYEVIGGELFVTPTPRAIHQKILMRLGAALEVFAVEHGVGELFGPLDVLFGEEDYLAPDLVFVRHDRLDMVTDRGAEGPPDLVVEVLSPKTAIRDRGIKRVRYAHFGVPEYWIVDPTRQWIEVYRLQEDAERPAEIASERLEWQPVSEGPVLTLDVHKLLRDYR